MYVDQIRGCSLARSGSARSAESIRRLDSIQSSFNIPKYIHKNSYNNLEKDNIHTC